MKKLSDLAIIILAAGKGTRMKSSLPKVMHKVVGLEMINHVIKAAQNLECKSITIVISEELLLWQDKIQATHSDLKINFVLQKERLGTANAAQIGLSALSSEAKNILILYGDTPLITSNSLSKMLLKLSKLDLCVLAFDCENENNYGRLVTRDYSKNEGQLDKIVEYKDATEIERKITLCNSGIVAITKEHLINFLAKVDNQNAAKEYYLTDIVKIAKQEGFNCGYLKTHQNEVLGVNSMLELAKLELIAQNELRKKFMESGVCLIDPATVYFNYDTKIAPDVTIHPNVVFGKEVKIANFVEINSFCHIEGAQIGQNAIIGPFARIRPSTKIGSHAKIGNFVEVKKSTIENYAKVNHLSYIGDSRVGHNTNIGASTITCNYDGYNKFTTDIGDNVFIGSHATLIAPLKIEDGSIIGAGSVITKNVSKDSMAIARSKQTEIEEGGKKYHLRKAKNKK